MEKVLKDSALFMRKDFFCPADCSKLCLEVDAAKQYRTPMLDFETRTESDTVSHRNPKIAFDFSRSLFDAFEQKLLEIKPSIGSFFSLKLGDNPSPHITVWKPGDFSGCHLDASVDSDPDEGLVPRIVVLLFLNDNVDYEIREPSPKTYTGGNLTLYGMIRNETFEKHGYPLRGQTGMLAAFKATSPHEVTPVISGMRYVLKTGFY